MPSAITDKWRGMSGLLRVPRMITGTLAADGPITSTPAEVISAFAVITPCAIGAVDFLQGRAR